MSMPQGGPSGGAGPVVDSQFAIRLDLGPGVQIADLSRRIGDLSTMVEIGCRWAVQIEASRTGRSESGLPLGLLSGDRTSDGSLLFWSVVDARAADELGSPPPVVKSLTYANPVELILAGSALLPGVVLAGRFVRDWSAKRRVNDAVAREAEAEARMTESRAELYAFLVEEAKADNWRLPLPARELMQITSDADLKALNRIAEDQVTIAIGDSPSEDH